MWQRKNYLKKLNRTPANPNPTEVITFLDRYRLAKVNKNNFPCQNLNQPTYSLFKSHLVFQIWTIVYVEYFVNCWEICLVEHFVRKNYDSTYCKFLNIKLRHGYFSENITVLLFSEQVLLKHLQKHIILLMSKSEHMLS